MKTTLTFSRLLKLRASDQHKDIVYERYNRIQMNGVKGMRSTSPPSCTRRTCAPTPTTSKGAWPRRSSTSCSAGPPLHHRKVRRARKPKSTSGFRDKFRRRTFGGAEGGIRLPNPPVEDVSDAYSLYVGILGVPEGLFWHGDVALVHEVAANDAAYRAWRDYAVEKESRRNRG